LEAEGSGTPPDIAERFDCRYVRRDAGEGSKIVVVTNWLAEVRAKLAGK
jgi:hypothetical protein